MNQDLSIFTLVTQASFVVQLVMAGLLIASLASWTVIFGKLFGLKRVNGENEEFEREFWAGCNLNELYADAAKRTDGAPTSMPQTSASGNRSLSEVAKAPNPVPISRIRFTSPSAGTGVSCAIAR